MNIKLCIEGFYSHIYIYIQLTPLNWDMLVPGSLSQLRGRSNVT